MTFGVRRVVNLCSGDIPDDAHCSNQCASSTTHTRALAARNGEHIMAVCSFRTRHKGGTSGIRTETLEKSGEAVCDSLRRSLMVVIRRPVRWWWLVRLSMALTFIVFRDWDLAVAPHGVLGCQDERSEAGQRLGHLQEWMLQTDGQSDRGGKTLNIISWGVNSIFRINSDDVDIQHAVQEKVTHNK